MFFIGLVVSHDQFIDLENVNICYIRGHFAQLGGPFLKRFIRHYINLFQNFQIFHILWLKNAEKHDC